MKTACSRLVWTIGLLSVSVAAMAGEATPRAAQEPVGFITGAVVGAFAAGPVGAVIGAGIGSWLGNRVHRAGEAARAEAEVATLRNDTGQLQADKQALVEEKNELSRSNAALTSRLDQLSHSVDVAQSAGDDAAKEDAAKVLDGLQGDILFRTGSAEISSDMAQSVAVLAQAVAKSPALKVRVDGYADPRGTAEANLKLSEARANAVRDLFVAAGVDGDALQINAYGKSQSTAEDRDGYALERRVRLTLQADGAEAVARN